MKNFRLVASIHLPEFGLNRKNHLGYYEDKYEYSFIGKFHEKFPAFAENCTDIAILEENFVPKAAFFDMDSTLTPTESIVELAREVGLADEIERVTKEAMAGKLDFAQALEARVLKLKGADAKIMDRVRDRLSFNPGVELLAQTLRKKNIPMFVISGGFNPLAKAVCDRLEMQGFCANDLTIRDGKITGEISGRIIDRAAKESWVKEVCQQQGFDVSKVIAAGDGANDLGMLACVGLPVGFKPNKILLPSVNVVLGSGDFTFLKRILFD